MAEGEVTMQGDERTFVDVLGRAVAALEREGVAHVVFGSIASVAYGRPGNVGDIDILVRPPEARRALEALSSAGFETEETDPDWIFKAFDRGVLIDLIFRVKGEIYLDDEMLSRGVRGEFAGRSMRLMAPEDALMVEAVSHEAQAAEHWFNALAIVSTAELDWEYVLRRASFGARRLLSLLIYADDIGRLVPHDVIADLLRRVYPHAAIPSAPERDAAGDY
jgi:hypothetical protein